MKEKIPTAEELRDRIRSLESTIGVSYIPPDGPDTYADHVVSTDYSWFARMKKMWTEYKKTHKDETNSILDD